MTDVHLLNAVLLKRDDIKVNYSDFSLSGLNVIYLVHFVYPSADVYIGYLAKPQIHSR